MTDPTRIEDLDHRESINNYLVLCALVAEGRRRDAFAYLTSLDQTEQIDMWLAGCSITLGFADTCRQVHKIQLDLPTWLRAMSLTDDDEAEQ